MVNSLPDNEDLNKALTNQHTTSTAIMDPHRHLRSPSSPNQSARYGNLSWQILEQPIGNQSKKTTDNAAIPDKNNVARSDDGVESGVYEESATH